MHGSNRNRRPQGGGILLTTLVFAVVIATMLGGLGTLVISYYSRSTTESQYANAINLADAGVNYEYRKITQNVASADLPGSGSTLGTTVSFGPGTFTVYCTNINGTSWDGVSSPFYIMCTGKIGTASRQVQCKSQGYNSSIPNFGCFATNSITISNSSCKIASGDIGCNGSITCNGQVPNGKCYLCGSGSSQTGFSGTCVSLPGTCNYPTCSSYATTCFPNSGSTAPGGLSYLQNHNDNSKCGLSTYNANINGNCTLTGPCNVYVNSVYLSGSSKITCNNTNGPCNVWIAPGSGSCHFEGTSSVTCTSNSASNACTFFCSNSGNWTNNYCSCDVHNTCNLQANFYCCNSGYGTCQFNDSPTLTGSCIGYNCQHLGATNCTTVASQVTAPVPFTSYGFAKVWAEQGGM